MNRKCVCVVTGSRAEYGLLRWVLHDLRADEAIDMRLVVTGTHLAPGHGFTASEIEADGFRADRRVEMLLAGDSSTSVAKSMGLGVIGMADALDSLRPDVVLVLGDRFEILAAAQACLILRIPLAHIAGGDVTEGAIDESVRHAITKMAHVHLVTHEDSAARVRQMGEDPSRVHVVGHPGLDHILRGPLLDRQALEISLGAPLGPRNILITFHPVTLAGDDGLDQFAALLAALEELPPDVRLWFTRPNADMKGLTFGLKLDEWVAGFGSRARVYTSLGHTRYLSLLAQVDVVAGNSSSGLYEAPSFGIPTVDIGDRQRGRIAASSVLHCEPERSAIANSLKAALGVGRQAVVNPYGDGEASRRIVRILRGLPPTEVLLRKPFFSLGGVHA